MSGGLHVRNEIKRLSKEIKEGIGIYISNSFGILALNLRF